MTPDNPLVFRFADFEVREREFCFSGDGTTEAVDPRNVGAAGRGRTGGKCEGNGTRMLEWATRESCRMEFTSIDELCRQNV